jgi:hypothetical protein
MEHARNRAVILERCRENREFLGRLLRNRGWQVVAGATMTEVTASPLLADADVLLISAHHARRLVGPGADEGASVIGSLGCRVPVLLIAPEDKLGSLAHGLGLTVADGLSPELEEQDLISRVELQIRWWRAARKMRTCCPTLLDCDPITLLPGPLSLARALNRNRADEPDHVAIFIQPEGLDRYHHCFGDGSYNRSLRVIATLCADTLTGCREPGGFLGRLASGAFLLVVPPHEAPQVGKALGHYFPFDDPFPADLPLERGPGGLGLPLRTDGFCRLPLLRLNLVAMPVSELLDVSLPADDRTAVDGTRGAS